MIGGSASPIIGGGEFGHGSTDGSGIIQHPELIGGNGPSFSHGTEHGKTDGSGIVELPQPIIETPELIVGGDSSVMIRA